MLTLAVAACGGGGGGDSVSGATTPTPQPSPFGLGAADKSAARFLLQATVGITDADFAAIKAQGAAAWLTAQMSMPMGERAWDWMISVGLGDIDSRALYDSGAFTVEAPLARQMTIAPDAVRKRVALALSEYFVVSTYVAGMPWTGLAMAHYWDQLNEHAFGNFRDLLEAMTLNPTMGAWLNTRGNLKEDAASGRVPDENYAREVMQLFTLGLVQLNLDGTPKTGAGGQPLPSYTQDDVSNLARVFTGYDWWDDGRRFVAPATNSGRPYPEYTRRAMVFDASRHSTLSADFIGISIPANTDGAAALRLALDGLFQHPNVGPFFGRQMIQRLVTSNPSQAYVARVAAAFNDNGAGVRGDLKAVWRAILLDAEARSDAGLTSTTHGKLREPMVRVFQWMRSFAASSRSGLWPSQWPVADPLYWFGQLPLSSPSVFNFFRPGYVPPGTSMAVSGATTPEFQIVNESSVSQWVNFIDRLNLVAGVPSFAGPSDDLIVDFTAEKPLTADLVALIRRLNLLLAAGQISDVTAQRIVDVLKLGGAAQPGSSDEVKRFRVIAAVTIVMSCAEYLVQK
ncbi:DUF1800 domain-containing protein [Leptothrix discophora]|uniref:DUF1800 family protein n=1 Tax=Leptothrix discophora TaxID=89 RepID=A0ABT9G8F5_LEPDI|nr:DUF1800 family protein [Leptothrix discophora]MDP4302685.1 DUF1800 family protein [Leptothrix discophora]